MPFAVLSTAFSYEVQVVLVGDDARQAEQRARRVVGVDAQADAGFLGGGDDLAQEASEVFAQAVGGDVGVTIQHAAQAGDVVAVIGARQAGHDGGEQLVLVGFRCVVEPGAGAGEDFGRRGQPRRLCGSA